jgi:predicted PurR-regulated permease PerM
MRPERRIVFWIAALVVFLLFLQIFRSILLPFVAGMGLAYVLDPLASWFQRRGFSRMAATLTILFLFIVFLFVGLIIAVPLLVDEATAFVARIPDYVESLQKVFASLLNSRVAQFFGIDSATLGTSLRGLLGQGATLLTGLLASLLSGGQALLAILSLLVITPVVAFYLLFDWEPLVAYLDSLLPREHVAEIRAIAREIDRRLAAFARGQGLICLILALFYGLGLAIAGINFGFLVGLAAGVLSFIPYVGTALGVLGGTALALAQYWPDWGPAVAAASVFVAGQVLADYLLTPRLIGANVGLHPVFVIFSFFAFGLLFGFVGLIIAIPAAAAIGVLVRFGIARYLDSSIYRGKGVGKTPP